MLICGSHCVAPISNLKIFNCSADVTFSNFFSLLVNFMEIYGVGLTV